MKERNCNNLGRDYTDISHKQNVQQDMIERIRKRKIQQLRKERACLRPKHRSTTEQRFILRYILEQTNELKSALYVYFIDFEKAFD